MWVPMFPTLAVAVCVNGPLPDQLIQLVRGSDLTILFDYGDVYKTYGATAPPRCFQKGTFVASALHTLLDPVRYTFDWTNFTVVTVREIGLCKTDIEGPPLPPCLPAPLEIRP